MSFRQRSIEEVKTFQFWKSLFHQTAFTRVLVGDTFWTCFVPTQKSSSHSLHFMHHERNIWGPWAENGEMKPVELSRHAASQPGIIFMQTLALKALALRSSYEWLYTYVAVLLQFWVQPTQEWERSTATHSKVTIGYWNIFSYYFNYILRKNIRCRAVFKIRNNTFDFQKDRMHTYVHLCLLRHTIERMRTRSEVTQHQSRNFFCQQRFPLCLLLRFNNWSFTASPLHRSAHCTNDVLCIYRMHALNSS